MLVENEFKKLQKFDSSYFRGRNYFEGDDGTKNHLVFQPKNKYFKRISGVSDGEYINFWKSKGLSDEDINSITTSNCSITPKLSYLNAKIRVNFSGSCLKRDNINTYAYKAIIYIYIVYKLNPIRNYFHPTVENCLFGAVKLIKNADIDTYKYSRYGIGFDSKESFLFSDGSFAQNVIIFGADMSSFVHTHEKKKYILILGESPTQGLDDTKLTTEKKNAINFTVNNTKFCLRLHYNGADSYLFVNGTEIHKFKEKNSLSLGKISEDFSVDNMKKTGLYGHVYDVSIDHKAIAADKILDIYKYLMEKDHLT